MSETGKAYNAHTALAKKLVAAYGRAADNTETFNVAIAQVHAILALAAAVRGLDHTTQVAHDVREV